jgi:hypothetical protein
MTKTTLSFTAAIIAVSLLYAIPAQAQNPRSFVSAQRNCVVRKTALSFSVAAMAASLVHAMPAHAQNT